jgi:hypothetical protein
MDHLEKYRDAIESILTDVARITPSTADVTYKTIFDRRADSYGLLAVGWNDDRRVHHFVIHIEIINGKVWLQEDNTDLVIAEELERAGIPKSDIVLGFHPADVRPFTEYAVAA